VSIQEENYIKAIWSLSVKNDNGLVGTVELARMLNLKPPSVNQMLKKLKAKKWINVEKYGKISLTISGRKKAVQIIRKHRIWETFLHDKLKFSWEEVHELAEYLEHIPSDEIINRLEKYLNYPQFDPHGDPIPAINGKTKNGFLKTLDKGSLGTIYKIVSVPDSEPELLRFMNKIGIRLNDFIKFKSRIETDNMAEIVFKNKTLVVGPTFLKKVKVICKNCLQNKKCFDEISCSNFK
jgi:DtxR family Mn-dependent transcriptional regulator